jgi:hypothetical protein
MKRGRRLLAKDERWSRSRKRKRIKARRRRLRFLVHAEIDRVSLVCREKLVICMARYTGPSAKLASELLRQRRKKRSKSRRPIVSFGVRFGLASVLSVIVYRLMGSTLALLRAHINNMTVEREIASLLEGGSFPTTTTSSLFLWLVV